MTWKIVLAKLLDPKVYGDNDDKRTEIIGLSKRIEALNEEKALFIKTTEVQTSIITDLTNQLSSDTPLEVYCKDNFQIAKKFAYKDKSFYKDKGISMYPNELITPDQYLVVKERAKVRQSSSKKIWYENVGRHVTNTKKWVADSKNSKWQDRYNLANESLVSPEIDCEDHSAIVASIEPEIGIAFGKAGNTWHAFNVFVYEGVLFVLETNNTINRNEFKVLCYDRQTHYKIHHIYTQNYTFVIDDSVQFGVKLY